MHIINILNPIMSNNYMFLYFSLHISYSADKTENLFNNQEPLSLWFGNDIDKQKGEIWFWSFLGVKGWIQTYSNNYLF